MIVTFASLGRMGRLCNQMFQVAGTIGIARRNGFDFAFPEWRNYDHRDRFGSVEDIDVQKYFVNPLPRYDGPPLPDHFVDWGYHDVRLDHSASLSGHMQSLRYFEHALDEVRWYFRMHDEYPPSSYTAIHVRRGDYDDQYHPRIPESYYREAMRRLSGPYLVFSDDIVACRQMFGSDVEYANGNYLDDFKRLKSCINFIISNSSYPAMAAILSDAPGKQVIAPDPWFGPAYTQITGQDIYCDDWQVIKWR